MECTAGIMHRACGRGVCKAAGGAAGEHWQQHAAAVAGGHHQPVNVLAGILGERGGYLSADVRMAEGRWVRWRKQAPGKQQQQGAAFAAVAAAQAASAKPTRALP